MGQFQGVYATAADFYVPIIKVATNNFAVGADWTPAAGDCKVSIDGGAAANITTLPTAIVMGNGAYWKFPLSAAEMTGKRIAVTVVDAATKAVEDQMFVVGTVDHQSALDPRGVILAGTAQGGAPDAITFPATASAVDEHYTGARVEIVGGTGAGQANNVSTGYVGATKSAPVVRTWVVEPDNTSVIRVYAAPLGTTAAETSAAVVGSVVEGAYTMKGILRIAFAALSGKSTGGGKTFRDVADAKNRIVATTDGSGNRTAVTLDVTD